MPEGAPTPQDIFDQPPPATSGAGAGGRFSRSLRVQLVALIVIFLLLPILLYSVFASADRERQELLLEAVQNSGAIVGKALTPFLRDLKPGAFGQLPAELARFEAPRQSIKLLFKPSSIGESAGFFYVASAPEVATAEMQDERAFLARIGVLDKLAESCTGDIPMSEHVPRAGGQGSVLTSVTPVQSPAGCWGVVVALDPGALGQSDKPYWMRAETRAAGIVYGAMAILAFAIFAVVWSNLRRFKSVAGAIENGVSFEESTTVPELAAIGREFDAMVHRLTRVADIIRAAAEDNAHAFKGPIAVIRQAVELVRPAAHSNDAETGIAAISASLDRLDGLVQSARRIDSATAELLEMGRARIDLSSLVRAFAADYGTMIGGTLLGSSGARNHLKVEAADNVMVEGRADLIETILENLVENALSFSPPGGEVLVRLRVESPGGRPTAVLTVADQGPGVHPDQLEAIFERYYSSRPGAEKIGGGGNHFGIGLWLVKQHAIALNGSVIAEDRPDGGLAVTVRMPAPK
jgi:two-component system sensor histidine kinase ChvG